jgi:hypothetical protein
LLVVASANGSRVTARSRLLRALGPGLITGASDEFKVNGGLMIVGWIATAVMAGAATAMCFTTALSVIEM